MVGWLAPPLCSFCLSLLLLSGLWVRILGLFDRAGAVPGWFGPLPRGAGMFDGAHTRRAIRSTCDGQRIPSRDTPRIVSEAAVVRRPPSEILADPVTLLLSRRGVRRLYGIPAPGKGVDATVTAPDEWPRLSSKVPRKTPRARSIPTKRRTRRGSGSSVPLPTGI